MSTDGFPLFITNQNDAHQWWRDVMHHEFTVEKGEVIEHPEDGHLIVLDDAQTPFPGHRVSTGSHNRGREEWPIWKLCEFREADL